MRKNTTPAVKTDTAPPQPPPPFVVQKWLERSGITCGTLVDKVHHHNYSYSDNLSVWVKVSRIPVFDFAEKEYETTTKLHQLGHQVPVALTKPQLSPDGKHVYTAWEYIPNYHLKWPGWTEQRIETFWETVKSVHSLPTDYASRTIPEQYLSATETRLANAHHLHDNLKEELKTTAREVVENWRCVVNDGQLKFTHGDVHPQNVIWLSEDKCMLIDWESPRRAPLEWDMACVYRNIANSKQKNSHELAHYFLASIPHYCKETFKISLYTKTLGHILYFAFVNKKSTKIEKTFSVLKEAIKSESLDIPFPLKEYYK